MKDEMKIFQLQRNQNLRGCALRIHEHNIFSYVLSGDSDQPDQRVPDRVAGGLHGDRLSGLLLRPGRPDAHLRQPAGRSH